ncbi:DUF4129 domain-containing protein, partial [Pseudomonas syringae pv. actinidiae]|nr:DUF4129 domain-containing protein [Pseudomonas syringae pv. actinidiae]
VLLIGVGLALSTAPAPVLADQQSYSCPLPETDQTEPDPSLAAPDAPRLTHQTLTSEAAQSEIQGVLQQPPFKNIKTQTAWRFPEKDKTRQAARDHDKQGWLITLLDRIAQAASSLASLIEVLLWGFVIGLAGLVLWYYRDWLKTFVSRAPRKKTKTARVAPEQLFGLQVSAESLPDDVAGQAEQLWNSQPREALGLLYRALLSRLLSDYRLPLKMPTPKVQVLQRIASLNQPLLSE